MTNAETAALSALASLDAAALRAVVLGWARLATGRGVQSLTTAAALDGLYAGPSGDHGATRAGLEHLAGSPPGERPPMSQVGQVMRRRVKGRPVAGLDGGTVVLVVDGLSGGATRWRVLPVPSLPG